MRAYVSTDGGVTWSFDGTPSGAQTNADKPQLWIDHSSTSPYRDTLYSCWRSGALAYVARRTAAGWSASIKVSGKETKSSTAGCHVITNQSSPDNGVTWSPPLQVTTAQTDETTAGANPYDQFGDYNGMAAFLTLFQPVWTDRRNGGAEEIWTAPIIDP